MPTLSSNQSNVCATERSCDLAEQQEAKIKCRLGQHKR